MGNNIDYKQNYERLEQLLFNVGEYLYEFDNEFRDAKHSQMCFGMTKEEHSKFILGMKKISTSLAQNTNVVYALTIDNKDNGWCDTFNTRLFNEKQKAIEEARKIVAEFESDCSDLEGWEYQKEDSEDCFTYSAYEGGYYDRNHYNVKVEQIAIE